MTTDRWRPFRNCFYFLVLLLPLAFDPSFTIDDPYNLPKILLLRIILIFFLAAILFKQPIRVRIPNSPLNLPILLFLAVSWFSLLPAASKVDAIHSLVLRSCQLFFYLLVLILVQQEDHRLNLFRSFAGSGSIVAAYGVFQSVILQPNGLDFSNIKDNFDPISTLGHRNMAAGFLLLVVPAACLLLLYARRKSDHWLGAGSLILGMSHLIFTKSRGAWLGFLAELAVLAIFAMLHPRTVLRNRRRVRHTLLLVSTVVVAILILSSLNYPYSDRFRSAFDPSSGTARFRVMVWQSTLRMIRQWPILGVGAGNFRQQYPLFRNPEESDFSGEHIFVHKVHNDHLQFWVEGGFPMLLAWSLLLMSIAYSVLREIRTSGSTTPWMIFSLAAVVGTLTHSLFSFGLHASPATGAIFYAILAICSLSCRGEKAGERLWLIRTPQTWSLLMAILLILLGFTIGVIPAWRSAVEFRSGRSAIKSEDFPSAIHFLEQASEHNRSDFEIYYNLGYAYAMTHNLELAYINTERALKLFPHYRNALFNQAYILEISGRLNEAAEYYQRALELDPKNLSATNNLIVILRKLGRLEDGINIARTTLKHHPNSPDAHLNLGVILFITGDYIEAYNAFYKTAMLRNRIVFNRSTVNHFTTIGEVEFRIIPCRENGTPMLATDWGKISFSPVSDVEPEIYNPIRGGRFRFNSERGELVLELEERARIYRYRVEYRIKGLNGHFDYRSNQLVFAKAYNNMARCKEKLGEQETVGPLYEMAIHICPDYASPYKNYGLLLYRQGNDPEKALRYLQTAEKLIPKTHQNSDLSAILDKLRASKSAGPNTHER